MLRNTDRRKSRTLVISPLPLPLRSGRFIHNPSAREPRVSDCGSESSGGSVSERRLLLGSWVLGLGLRYMVETRKVASQGSICGSNTASFRRRQSAALTSDTSRRPVSSLRIAHQETDLALREAHFAQIDEGSQPCVACLTSPWPPRRTFFLHPYHLHDN